MSIQLYVFAVGFLCGACAATLLLLGGTGRLAVLAAAVLLGIAIIVAHHFGIVLVLTIHVPTLADPIDFNTFIAGCSGGKGLMGLVFPTRPNPSGQ